MKLVDYQSELWGVYRGAYGSVKNEVEILMGAVERIPPQQKLRRLDPEPKSDVRIAFDNLCENLYHQMSFYDATYLVLPYMATLLERKETEEDFEWQLLILSEMGAVLATDIPYGQYQVGNSKLPEELLDSYEESISILQTKAKAFLFRYSDRLRQLEHGQRVEFCIGLAALLGNRKVAYVMIMYMDSWAFDELECPGCKHLEEDLDLDEPEQQKKIQPAPSLQGKWDKKSYEDTYLWLSHVLELLGETELKERLRFLYGTYTCPQCGRKEVTINLLEPLPEEGKGEPEVLWKQERERKSSFFATLLKKIKGLFSSNRISSRRKEEQTGCLNKEEKKPARRFENILEDNVYSNIETYQKEEYREIFDLWKQKNYSLASECCTKRLKETPEDMVLYILRSYCYKMLSNRVKQDQDLTAALKLSPDNIWILRARLCGIATKKRCLRHIEDITHLMELDPENYDEYLVHRAYYYHWTEDEAAARKDLLTVEEHKAAYAMSTADFCYLYNQLIAGQQEQTGEHMGQEWWKQ